MLSQLTVKPPRIRYPQTEPKEWGQHYWYFFHENASLYPENPTPEDVSKEQEHINYFITHLPCKQLCEPNATAYVRDNPPDLTSKKAYFAWTILFHNAINQETGSVEHIENPEELLGDGTCDNCKIPTRSGNDNSGDSTGDEQSGTSHDSDAKFNDSVKRYKESVRTLVRDIYRKEGKEPPEEIIFSKCGDGSDTSCAMVIDGKHYSFYHPRDLVKTLFHEVDHHIDARSGKKIDDSLNDKANKYATAMIEKYFPFDKVMMDKKGNVLVAHDTTIIRDSVPIPSGGGGIYN